MNINMKDSKNNLPRITEEIRKIKDSLFQSYGGFLRKLRLWTRTALVEARIKF
jgi:hypothetical protein